MVYSTILEKEEINNIFGDADQYLRNVAVDNVIFGYHDKELKVLLQKPFVVDKWTVAGGYIRKTESIEEAAARVAHARTGLKDLYLQQFRAFGNPGRVKDSGFTAQHISEVESSKRLVFPQHLADEFTELIKAIVATF